MTRKPGMVTATPRSSNVSEPPIVQSTAIKVVADSSAAVIQSQTMQAASAFTIVQAAFNWLVDNYPKLAEWGASARRVASLELSLDALDRAETGFGLINRSRGEEAALRLGNLRVTLDDGTAVVKDADVAIMPGEKVLVGAGKST